MKQTATILISFMIAIAALAEEFTLADPETGERFGPFTYSNGAPVIVDGRTLHLERIKTKASQLEDRMKSIIIPSIEFRQANILDVLQFLSDASVGGIERPSVSIVPLGLCVNEQGRPVTNAPTAEFFSEDFFVEETPEGDVPRVTLNLRRISLYDALGVVCEVAGLTFRVDERGVVFVKPSGEEVRAEEIQDQRDRIPHR